MAKAKKPKKKNKQSKQTLEEKQKRKKELVLKAAQQLYLKAQKLEEREFKTPSLIGKLSGSNHVKTKHSWVKEFEESLSITNKKKQKQTKKILKRLIRTTAEELIEDIAVTTVGFIVGAAAGEYFALESGKESFFQALKTAIDTGEMGVINAFFCEPENLKRLAEKYGIEVSVLAVFSKKFFSSNNENDDSSESKAEDTLTTTPSSINSTVLPDNLIDQELINDTNPGTNHLLTALWLLNQHQDKNGELLKSLLSSDSLKVLDVLNTKTKDITLPEATDLTNQLSKFAKMIRENLIETNSNFIYSSETNWRNVSDSLANAIRKIILCRIKFNAAILELRSTSEIEADDKITNFQLKIEQTNAQGEQIYSAITKINKLVVSQEDYQKFEQQEIYNKFKLGLQTVTSDVILFLQSLIKYEQMYTLREIP